MGYQEHKQNAPQRVSCAVLTISDSRTEQDDESGKLIRQKLSENGHRVMSYAILKNEAESIEQKIRELLRQEGLQVIITSVLRRTSRSWRRSGMTVTHVSTAFGGLMRWM